jgi:hypothetical protein
MRDIEARGDPGARPRRRSRAHPPLVPETRPSSGSPRRTAQRDEDHGGSGPGCRAAHCDRPGVADRVSAGLE